MMGYHDAFTCDHCGDLYIHTQPSPVTGWTRPDGFGELNTCTLISVGSLTFCCVKCCEEHHEELE